MKFIFILSLLASFAAQAKPYKYECFSFYWNGDSYGKGTMDLEIKGKTASADIREESWDNFQNENLNPNYRSRGETEYVKYGSELIVEKALTTGGKRLRDGNWGGFVRVEGEAEGGFYQYKFICKLK